MRSLSRSWMSVVVLRLMSAWESRLRGTCPFIERRYTMTSKETVLMSNDPTATSLDKWPADRILRTLRCISRLPLQELEDLSQDIWLECFEKNGYCSRKLILWRYLDHLKECLRRKGSEDSYARERGTL